ncbi:MAG: putative Ig domain-containing protein, partial [Luteolibacter sp.]
NVAPVLAAIPPQTVEEGVLLTFTASATDVDLPANTLTYSLVNAPAGASIDPSTGIFTWTPTEAQGPGSFNFTVQVSDGNLTADQPVSVTVSEANVAPVLAAIPAQTVDEGVLLTFTATVSDTDLPANTLTYTLSGDPVGASIDPGTGVFSWTPAEAPLPGSFNFTVQVSDGNLIDDQIVTVSVNEANAAPLLAAIPPQTVDEGVLLTFTASATDTDLPANTLTYSLVDAPVGAAIDPSTGVFTWTPTEAQGPGSFNFTVQVSDGNLTADQPVSVTVNEANVAPVLAAIPAQTVDEGVLLTFTASATDTDLPANTLTYSLITAPVGAAIDPSTGVFTWTPTEAQGPGSYNFTVQVTDGNLTADQPVSVTVGSALPSPEIDTDADGLSDLLEFAFGSNPALPSSNPFHITGTGGGNVTLAFPWNWQAAGLTWQIRHGQDLSNYAAWPVVPLGATTVTREGNIDRITVSPAMAHPGHGFYILEVNGN